MHKLTVHIDDDTLRVYRDGNGLFGPMKAEASSLDITRNEGGVSCVVTAEDGTVVDLSSETAKAARGSAASDIEAYFSKED